MFQLRKAAEEIVWWLKADSDLIEYYHRYAQQFGCPPGHNVYTFVLVDALKSRGLTVEQFTGAKRAELRKRGARK